jgi:hypothetical protein
MVDAFESSRDAGNLPSEFVYTVQCLEMFRAQMKQLNMLAVSDQVLEQSCCFCVVEVLVGPLTETNVTCFGNAVYCY